MQLISRRPAFAICGVCATVLAVTVLTAWLALPLRAQQDAGEDSEPVPEAQEGTVDGNGVEGQQPPVDDQGQPPEGQEAPVDGQGNPVDEQGQPAGGETTQPNPGQGDGAEGALPPEGEVAEPQPGEQALPEGEGMEEEVPAEEAPAEGETSDEPAEEAEKPPPDPALERAKRRLERLREKTASLKKSESQRPGSTRITRTGASSRRAPVRQRSASPSKEARTTAPKTGTAKTTAEKEGEAEPEGLVGAVKAFVSEHQNWLLGALGAGLLASLAYLFVGSRRRRRHDDEEEIDLIPLGHLNVDDEDDGPRRVLVDPRTGKPQEVARKDDTEYALVVDEDELQIQQGHIERLIDKLVEDEDYERAYERFREYQQEGNTQLKPRARSERRLARHFLDAGELEKAETVLEHHVSTRADSEIDPRIYFDLGYISFKRKTLSKSREYFRTYADRESDARLTGRARKVLEQLEGVKSLN